MEASSEDGDEAVFDNLAASPDESLQSPLSLNPVFPGVDTPATSGVESDLVHEIRKCGKLRRHSLRDGMDEITELSARPQKRRKLLLIEPSHLIYPKSRYDGYVPPLPICKERKAVQELREELGRQNEQVSQQAKHKMNGTQLTDEDDFMEMELLEFAIYLPNNRHHGFELRPLQSLVTKNGHSVFLFDGILSVGNVRRYVQAVPFEICSIGNYGDDMHTVGDNIWIQSIYNSKTDLFYRLKSPSSEYERFHNGFLWLADLAKHFVDYCQFFGQNKVSVYNFRTDFSEWLQKTHGASPQFASWYQQYGHVDFRSAVAANINFLFKESVGIGPDLRAQPIWRELLEKDAIPEHVVKETSTIVTPYVYECFSHLRFAHHLKVVEPVSVVQFQQASQVRALQLSVNDTPRRPRVEIPANTWTCKPRKFLSPHIYVTPDPVIRHQNRIKAIQVGDVLSVTKDGHGSVWKDEVSRWKAADDCWFILVQGVHETKHGQRSFDGIWLYKPSDTCCAKMKYPFAKELFLSDNCTCSQSRIAEEEVLDLMTVAWHGRPSESNSDYFIRQTYLENEKFVTLKDTHKKCEHLHRQQVPIPPEFEQKYPIGQTVLVIPPLRKDKHVLEPYEVVSYDGDGLKWFVVLRRLVRRIKIDGKGAPNELVYSDQTVKIAAEKIEQTCLVRFYRESDVINKSIPAPYNRDGTGNAFYITTRLVERDGIPVLSSIDDNIPKSLIQGFNPSDTPSRKLLRGLDLYCGGGNFGRGLEEGGALHNVVAVDILKTAIHTYFANLKDPEGTKLFFGSVNDLLMQALHGNPKNSNLVPLPGDIDIISAGSPCQGFSILNPDKNNDIGLKNQSLVASVAAYVDFYRPKYGLLENVMNMAQKGRGRDEDVLSQLICSIVGMGYQLQLFVVDAWSCGSAQSRSRLFVSFAAPGCEPLDHPQLSHSHPPKIADRGLGKLANGQSFGSRIHPPTPFEYVTAGEVTKDLPNIGDGQTYQCISHPDHVMAKGLSRETRLQIEAIPLHPRGMNFAKTWKEGKGTMSSDERALFPTVTKVGKLRHDIQPNSRGWGRVNPQGIFPTVVVQIQPADSRMGTCLHWDQQRILTLMEARRAQSFPDHEVLVGSPTEQLKLVGNSVARTVALALGLSLREAWLNNPPDVQGERVTVGVSEPFSSAITATPPNTHVVSRSITASSLTMVQESEESEDVDPPEPNFRHAIGSLALRPTPSQDKTSPSIEREIPTSSLMAMMNSLKRPFKSIQEARNVAPGNNFKLPRLSDLPSKSTSGASNSRENVSCEEDMTLYRRPQHHTLNASHLVEKLREIKRERFLQKPDYFAADDDEEDAYQDANEHVEAVGDEQVEISISQSSFPSPGQLNRFNARTISTPKRGRCKTLSKDKAKVIIDLISDDEDEVTALPNHKAALPSLEKYKYVPVDNSKFMAYAQTSRVMHGDRNRKYNHRIKA